jgi:hypothetical protein
MTVTIKGMDAVSLKLRNLQNFTQWATPPMQKTVALLHDEIAKYPTKAAGAFSRYATPKQRRAYWAKVRSGEIGHGAGGYIRTGTLGRKWVTKVENSINGVRGEVGNNTGYAQYVQQLASQQSFHKASGWTTEIEALRKTEKDRNAVWRVAVRRIIDK